MTLDQAMAALEGNVALARGNAESLRRRGDEYKRASMESDDPDLRSHQFQQASRLYAQARDYERDAEAMETVVTAAKGAAV